jgi:hypothetical protein
MGAPSRSRRCLTRGSAGRSFITSLGAIYFQYANACSRNENRARGMGESNDWTAGGHLQLPVLGLHWIHSLCSLCISSTQRPSSGRGRLVAGRPPFPARGPHKRLPEFHAATPAAGDVLRATGRRRYMAELWALASRAGEGRSLACHLAYPSCRDTLVPFALIDPDQRAVRMGIYNDQILS